MKTYFTYLLLFISLSIYAQSFNGNYKSYSTSYKDELDSSQNLKKEILHNLIIEVNEDLDDSGIFIQDPSIPDKFLAYRIVNIDEELSKYNSKIQVINCIATHLETPKSVKIAIYFDDDNNLNLMVYDKNMSQTFFDLIKQ